MPRLNTEKELQACQSLPFCYLCGQGFDSGVKSNRDHVPPKALFAKDHHERPLVLPAHPQCNGGRSFEDDIIKQLVAALERDQIPSSNKLRLSQATNRQSGEPIVILRTVDLRPIVWRWIRGFHAALYREYLPNDSSVLHAVHLPFAVGEIRDSTVVLLTPREQQYSFARELTRSRQARIFDQIVCYSGKCTYECVWTLSDAGQPFCVFALNIYEWHRWWPGQEPQGCVGAYVSPTGRPPGAARLRG